MNRLPVASTLFNVCLRDLNSLSRKNDEANPESVFVQELSRVFYFHTFIITKQRLENFDFDSSYIVL